MDDEPASRIEEGTSSIKNRPVAGFGTACRCWFSRNAPRWARSARGASSSTMDAVLRADYGDKEQKAINDAAAARSSAVGAGVRPPRRFTSVPPPVSRGMNAPSFHAQPDVPSVRSQVRDRVKNPVVPAMEKKAYRPPFWESKVYGEPYGDFNRRPRPARWCAWRSPPPAVPP